MNIINLKIFFLLPLLAVVLLTACTKTYEPITHRNYLTHIDISDTLNMFVGESRQIPLVTSPSKLSFDSLRFTSSDTTVLTISKSGLIAALKEGVSTLTVSNLANTISAQSVVTVSAPEPDSLLMGLIAWYPFSNNAADSSGNNYNGTLYNVSPVADRFGNAGSAYYFDGSSSYITVEDNEALRLHNTNFTLSMWVSLDRYIYASGSALLTKNNGADQNGWNCSIVGKTNQDGGTPGNLFYNVSGGADPFAVGSAIIDTTKWYMLTITYELNKHRIGLYINGVFDSYVINIPTPNANTNAKLHIGNNSYTDIWPAANQYFFEGKMDDVRIYNRKLSGSEIVKLYNLPDPNQ